MKHTSVNFGSLLLYIMCLGAYLCSDIGNLFTDDKGHYSQTRAVTSSRRGRASSRVTVTRRERGPPSAGSGLTGVRV